MPEIVFIFNAALYDNILLKYLSLIVLKLLIIIVKYFFSLKYEYVLK